MVDFHFSGKQIVKVKINCYFLDQVRARSEGGALGEGVWFCFASHYLRGQMCVVV